MLTPRDSITVFEENGYTFYTTNLTPLWNSRSNCYLFNNFWEKPLFCGTRFRKGSCPFETFSMSWIDEKRDRLEKLGVNVTSWVW